jgi:hypothetical protein
MRGARNFARLLLVIAVPVLVLGAWGTVQGARTWQWPRTQAVIVDADLRTFTQDARDNRAPEERHSFAVRYTYAVGGRDYTAVGTEPYDFGMQNSAGAQRMKERYPVGSTAQIAYDPDRPEIAYLMAGPSSFALVLVFVGVVMGLAALWVRNLAARGIGAMDGEDELEAAKGRS